MITLKVKKSIIILAFIYIAAAIIQSQLLLASDVCWQMQLARSVLHGGNYVQNFFETTPPLCFIVLMPEIAIEKLLLVSPIMGVEIYVFLLASVSLWMCAALLKKLFFKDGGQTIPIFLLSLALVFLILPLNSFGQREHFFVLLCMPYFLLVACRLENKQVGILFSVIIGLCGAIGFSIKPFFLTAFILVECYAAWVLYAQKKYHLSLETLIVIAFQPIYLAIIYIFFKPYLFTVVPITARFYYQSFSHPWSSLFLQWPAIFCLLCCLFFLFLYKKNPDKKFSTVLILAMMGNLFSLQSVNAVMSMISNPFS